MAFNVQIDTQNAADAESIVEILKNNISHLTEDIAYNIAVNLQHSFVNTPKEACGVD